MSTLKRTKNRLGFSLVEIVIALGIISVALTAMLGLMPIGLSTFRDSLQSTVQADVMRQLSSQFQETPFDQLTNSAAMIYYSDQGEKVSTDQEGLLGVKYSFTTNTPLLSSGTSYVNPYLKTATILFFTRADRARNSSNASITNVLYVAPGVH